MAVTVVRRADHRIVPWRNGGGTTREIAVRPGAAPDRFAWRLSIATVATPGPFSAFDGYDRTIMVIDGAGMILNLAGIDQPPLGLYQPFAFAGETKVDCRLVDGPIHDFNVMVDRATARANVEVVALGAPRRLDASGASRAIMVLEGRATIAPDLMLDPWDTAIHEPAAAITLAGAGTAAIVTIIGR